MTTSKLTRVLSAILALMMMMSLFVACAETGAGDESGATTVDPAAAATTAAPEPEETALTDDVPEYDFKGEDIVILARNREWVADEIYAEENGTIVNDAVYRRNELVNSRLGVNITLQGVEGTDNYAVRDQLQLRIDSGTDDVHLVVNAAYVAASTTASGLYRNLLSVPNIDFTKEYWSQGLNKAMRVGDAQYICSGAILLSYYRFIFVTFFNIDMFESNNLAPLYDTVESGEWTLEKQIEYTSILYQDRNGNGDADTGDVFGFMSNHDMIGVDGYWASCELPIIAQNADGYYEYVIDAERSVKAIDLLLELFWDTAGTMRVAHTTGDYEQDDIAQRFANEEAAMVTLRLIEVENDLVGMSNYGIVPLPRLDTAQQTYRSAIHDSFSAYSVPNFNFSDDELEMIGAVLEVMASQSYNTITPAYYEQALKGRYANDPQSVRMLDLITQNVWIDAGVLYCNAIDKPHNIIRNVIGSNVRSASQLFTQKKKVVSRLVDTLNTNLEKLLG